MSRFEQNTIRKVNYGGPAPETSVVHLDDDHAAACETLDTPGQTGHRPQMKV